LGVSNFWPEGLSTGVELIGSVLLQPIAKTVANNVRHTAKQVDFMDLSFLNMRLLTNQSMVLLKFKVNPLFLLFFVIFLVGDWIGSASSIFEQSFPDQRNDFQ